MSQKEELKKKLIIEIDKNANKISEIGEYLYNNPELGFKEFKCNQLITNYYQELGIKYQDKISITGTKTILKGKSHKADIALIGEMDAVYNPNHIHTGIEGASHCCGHNAQIAIMLGVLTAFNNTEVYKELNGNITFISTPAEELLDLEYRDNLIKKGIIDFYSGKQNMIKNGIFDNTDIVLSTHACANADEYIELGVSLVGFIIKKAVFRGRPAHSGLAPHMGINALSAANLCLNAINAIRETFKEEDMIRVSPIIKDNALAINIIPEKVEIESYVRAKSLEGILDTARKLDRCIKGASYSIGTECKIKNIPGYLPFTQDKTVNNIIYDNASELIEKKKINWGGLFAASGDVGDLSMLMPTIQMSFGGFNGIPHGNDFSPINRNAAYILPAKILACSIVDFLYDNTPKAALIKKSYNAQLKSKEEYIELLKKLKNGD